MVDLRQQHSVETPENVEVRLELAGVGSRAAALLLDQVILWVAGLVVSVVLAGALGLGGTVGGWALALLALLAFAYQGVYFALLEALNGGRTIGKQALGIRVVMDTGRPITPTAAVVRTLGRLIDCVFPASFLTGFFFIVFSKGNKRLGDMAAGTIVVRDRPTDWALGAPLEEQDDVLEAGPPELSEDEFRLLDRFLERLNDLDPAVERRMASELARRFATRIPPRTHDTRAYLVQVFADEQLKRRSRFATRAGGGASAAGRITVTAERFLAKKRAGWEAFRELAVRMERSGVGALDADEIPRFAARYREVAADLARARTYGVDARVVEYLERVVSAGHNALYRARGRRRTPLVRYVLRDFPAAVVQSWAYVLVAFLLFAVPGVAGYVLIRERPALAEEVFPAGMIDRAEQAAAREEEGLSYAQAEGEHRPLMAAVIISNNVFVSFLAFAGGLTAGVLTAWVLLSNGLQIGLVLGLFRNYNAFDYLMTFVAGHGVLELTAIFISAGAGFRLAKALVAPGDLRRADALITEGRIAARMIGAVVTLLALAGTIEGLFSASDAPRAWKYSLSAATALLLVLYLASGRRHLKDA